MNWRFSLLKQPHLFDRRYKASDGPTYTQPMFITIAVFAERKRGIAFARDELQEPAVHFRRDYPKVWKVEEKRLPKYWRAGFRGYAG